MGKVMGDTKKPMQDNKPKQNTKPKQEINQASQTEQPKSAKANPKQPNFKLPAIRKLHFKPLQIVGVIVVVLLAIFFGRVAIWEHNYINRMEGTERPTLTGPVEGSEDDTDREKPTVTEVSEYTVAPDKPRYLSIPSVGINNSRVVEIGVRNDGALSTPYNIYDTGWYVNSALPGASGTSIVDGHGGAPGIGVFGNLPLVQTDALINIVMGDGREFTYRVVDTATKPLGEEANEYMATAFTSPVKGKPSLTLITCTGDWWLSSQTYSHRFFARAVLVD